MATDSYRPDSGRVGAVDSPGFCPLPDPDPSGPARIARVEPYDDAPDECTIHPADAPADTLTTTWITAREGSFVRLDAMQ